MGHKLFGFFIFSFPIFSNDFHSFHNWEKINSMERKTKNHETHGWNSFLWNTLRKSLWLKPLGRAVYSGHQGSPISHHPLNLNQYVGPHCHSRASQYQDLGSHTRPSLWPAESPWSLSQRSLSRLFHCSRLCWGKRGLGGSAQLGSRWKTICFTPPAPCQSE